MDKKNSNPELTNKVKSIINANYQPKTDPFGSYTGKPINKKEKPVQDADDL